LALWDAFVMLFTDPLQVLDYLKGEIKGLLDPLLWDGAGDTIFNSLTSTGYDIWRSGAVTGSGQQSGCLHDQQRYQQFLLAGFAAYRRVDRNY